MKISKNMSKYTKMYQVVHIFGGPQNCQTFGGTSEAKPCCCGGHRNLGRPRGTLLRMIDKIVHHLSAHYDAIIFENIQKIHKNIQKNKKYVEI